MEKVDVLIAILLAAGFLLVIGGVWSVWSGAWASIVAGGLMYWLAIALIPSVKDEETATPSDVGHRT